MIKDFILNKIIIKGNIIFNKSYYINVIWAWGIMFIREWN